MSATKVEANTTNVLKQLFFVTNLHSVTSNQISTYRNLNLPLTSSIYFVFLSLEIQKKTLTDQTDAFSYYVWKEATQKPLKVAAKKPFYPVCMLLLQLASMNVFYSMW